MRGPNWEGDTQDGGEGFVGTVVGIVVVWGLQLVLTELGEVLQERASAGQESRFISSGIAGSASCRLDWLPCKLRPAFTRAQTGLVHRVVPG